MAITLAVAESAAAARIGDWVRIAVRKCLFLIASVATGLVGFLGAAQAQSALNTSQTSGLAIHGYDLVAYFEQHQARPGNPEITYQWANTRFAFSSEQNRDLFEANPGHYLPQFGGYCAYAAAHNAISDADPTAWQIVDGKLYLNYNSRVQKTWAGDLDSNIQKGHLNWIELSTTIQ